MTEQSAKESDRHLTALDLDLLGLADLAAADRQRIDDHAARCARCGSRRSEHEAYRARFRGAVFPRTSAAIVARRRALPSRLWLMAIALPVGAAGLLVITHSLDRRLPVADGPAVLGIKGEGVMEVFARRGGPTPETTNTAVMRVANGARLAPGDALRFVLYPTGLPYVLIASVDGAGQVSVYFPFRGHASAAIDPAAPVSVPGSIVLDHAAGPERLFAIFSENPLEVSAVRELLAQTAAGGASAIRSAARLPLAGTVQATLLFEKEHRQ
jgi:hypothetical protein